MSYEEEDTCVDPRAILAVQRLGPSAIADTMLGLF
jgi:hypothetical protein